MTDIKALLERYYNGETTLEEEQMMGEYLAAHPEEADAADGLLFAGITAIKDSRTAIAPVKKPRRIALRYIAAGGAALAAGLALLIGLRHTIEPPAVPLAVSPKSINEILVTPKASGEIKDEQQALEQARKALAYVSSKLNKGTAGMGRLNQLEQSISKIQNKKS